MNEPLSYKEAVKRSHKEAFYTLVASVFLCVFFWGAVCFTMNLEWAFWGLPLWFWLSCVGGYVLSVIAVWVLVKGFFRNFSLSVKKENKKP